MQRGPTDSKNLGKTGKEVLPIRVYNPTDTNRLVKKGTVLGTLTTIPEDDIQSTPPNTGEKIELPGYLDDLYQRSIEDIPEEYIDDVTRLLIDYQDVFAKDDTDLGRTGLVKHHIDTGQSRPIRQRQRRHPLGQREEIKRQVDDLLEKKLIEPTDSPWAANIVLVWKKDGSQRLCIDYRQLNNVTMKDAYPLPRIDETLDALAGAQWFSTLDLASGYWQVELNDDAKSKSAFLADGGLYA